MSTIEWTEETWNPVTGCSKVSEGCRNCYAEKMSLRFGWSKKPWTAQNAAENVILHPERLDKPMKVKKPTMYFVNSMSDLFHDMVPFDYIDQVFAIMALCPQHTFQVLTKRPERMMEYMNTPERNETIGHEAMYLYEKFGGNGDCRLPAGLIHGAGKISNLPYIPEHPNAWPLPNVWLGTSVENQRAADERIPHLLQTPAVIRFLSCEPLLSKVNLETVTGSYQIVHPNNEGYGISAIDGIDWVIAGAESGPGARKMDEDWVRRLRDECHDSGTKFFYKQKLVNGAKVGLPELDGKVWNEMPVRK